MIQKYAMHHWIFTGFWKKLYNFSFPFMPEIGSKTKSVKMKMNLTSITKNKEQ
ncbi:hypothetical protein ACFOG5_24660 [Pedobacter fastidiosus]|uniref:hypothetical protein n=1 Tax=Pedobacter fastidiosus TaxID=2765361 RepID=UPI00361AAC50